MKKSPDLSETLAKGAHEAKEILNQTAGLIEDEWKRLKDTVEDSEALPEGVKTAVGRLGDAVDELREFVAAHGPEVVNNATRAARQAGVPIPDSWGAETEDVTDDVTEDGAQAEAEDMTEETAEGAEVVDETAAAVADEVADGAPGAEDSETDESH